MARHGAGDTEETPVGTPGFPSGRSPGEGKMIALSTSTVPNDPQFLAGPLTPSLLVRAANPRHNLSRRSQRRV
jgi:hypothetical protein